MFLLLLRQYVVNRHIDSHLGILIADRVRSHGLKGFWIRCELTEYGINLG